MSEASSPDFLQQPVTALRGVGDALAEKLARLGIMRVEDLLFHLPLRYQDRTRIYPIAELKVGQEVLVEGEIESTEVVLRGRRMMLCHISDGTGILTLRFFHFTTAQKQSLRQGVPIRCFGEVRQAGFKLEMAHPEYRLLSATHPEPIENTLTPTYPATEGLQQRSLRRLIEIALEHVDELPDLLPERVVERHGFPQLGEVLSLLHKPQGGTPSPALPLSGEGARGRAPSDSSPDKGRLGRVSSRLVFEELLAHQLGVQQARHELQQVQAPAMQDTNRYWQQLLRSLPFAPTDAQNRVIGEITQDLQQGIPMNRLVQGDVGSGKTLVAVAAALHAIANGFQVALMAPTELLAEQHYQNLTRWLEPLGLETVFISGNQTPRQRRRKVENLLLGIGHIAVGTHALFQRTVEFLQLGLIIIDEQHRFGVHQRMSLREKGKQGDNYPHQLVMTATPIPRTLAMTAYGDLDYSVIDELPPGRTPITTVALSNERRDDVIGRIAAACCEGRQAYWVCTLIEESEALQCETAEDTAALLRERLPHVEVGLVHGRLHGSEKESIMRQFKQGEIQLLVATTVIEVGVDVPNASLMIIENAERFGLSQLHQLRGRVGRGSTASSCVLLYQNPLGKTARKRLDAMRNSTDGFVIADIDLELRGPGEVLGTRQTGDVRLRIASLLRDQHLLPAVQVAAREIVANYPERVKLLTKRWLQQPDGDTATRFFQS
ncbi:ATP-dependent DNA helicase RecG [Thiothrix nivea]|uniref:ATP-dependent DNA helicase RecG n=1 Tax=Thiothrix nivea (strain ATCC 35100 / DSM 5205 / JP2) TaxID=870187 RepID=A0A656HIV9_THINJ|nr:ATP-dependent DNA helicase RecG [Thiothrix nivea]EIJ36132.1 ATP-dependent DNA helicase RecG [Thiothrix nivea DSM 5205]